MILCFGAYATILMKCALPGTTNRVMVSTLVGTIDAGNRYGDKANDTSVSRLMNCAGNFPSIQVESTDGPIRSIVGAQTNVVALARSASTAALAEKFGRVMDLLDEDKKKSAVGALLKLISSDASLAENHRAMFIRCMGCAADSIIEEKEINLPVFLAGLFLYTVLTNENTRGKETLKVIKSDEYWEGLRSVSLRSGAAADLPEGHRVYMDRLYEKYNRIPTILYKEALTPFRDYYVPNNIEYRVPDPIKRHTYRVAQINGVTISRLLEISRYLVLSGTGGLGKSMMMRYLTLSMIDCFDRLGLIPFFIPLKDFETEFDSMLDYVFNVTRNLWPELTITQLDALLQKGCALLLFDGLDEIHTSKLGDFTKKMNAFQDRYPDNAFVISSRPYSNFQSFARSTVLQLQPFTKPQALELVDRYNYRADAPKLQARFRSQLDHELYRTHAGFSDNPLLLSIMMLTFEMDAEVPTVKYLFYQEAYTVLSRRHDAMKDGYTRRLATGWTANQFADYFAFFCAMTYRDGKVAFTLAEMDQYFRPLVRKYSLQNVSVDDFIYDLINNLCLMYQDGLNYGFIHRSFQEYFCAKFFNAQLDELLVHVIPLFDRNDTTKKGDKALEMLYQMKPKAVEKYLIMPYLEKLIADCKQAQGIWTFLEKIYPDYEIADGEAYTDDEHCAPQSNLYEFILDLYHVPLLSPEAGDYPGIGFYTQMSMVYREDTREDDWKDSLPIDYDLYYGEPEETGRVYAVTWATVHADAERWPDLLAGFIEAVEDPNKAFMAEYLSIQKLLADLKAKLAVVPDAGNLFDIMS